MSSVCWGPAFSKSPSKHKRLSPNVDLKLGHRQRCWPSYISALHSVWHTGQVRNHSSRWYSQDTSHYCTQHIRYPEYQAPIFSENFEKTTNSLIDTYIFVFAIGPCFKKNDPPLGRCDNIYWVDVTTSTPARDRKHCIAVIYICRGICLNNRPVQTIYIRVTAMNPSNARLLPGRRQSSTWEKPSIAVGKMRNFIQGIAPCRINFHIK